MKPIRPILACLFLFSTLAAACSPSAPNRVIPAAAVSPTPNAAQTIPPAASTAGYPRLGMWWPDLETQPLADVARYDWVILGDWDAASVPALKKLNPAILLLDSTNACELSFDPEADNAAEPWANADILKIPPQWFLTQVGSTLTAEVDAVSTTLHVAAVTADDGKNTYDLFIPGDAVLIDGESALVTAVDAKTLTLTVKRGYVRPASAHPAGTRIAAHISFWPNSWLLNLSTLSPLATVDENIGPENWSAYHARTDAALLDSAAWDGLLIDRSDPDESWLIGNSTARTIDPDQSNRLLSDYSAFDTAWNRGLRDYKADLRRRIGSDKLIYVNWGMANYDLLNGNNFEGFPGDMDNPESASEWYSMVFSPSQRNGSYFEWMKDAMQPNLTTIETYEDNGSPAATSDGSYDNPCSKPGFTPDYRKMRFGLTTALLNDGYYSYEMNTDGHGSLCLMWFDEYDNAGRGRGYLGQPLGAAYHAVKEDPASAVLSAGLESASGSEGWEIWSDESVGNSASLSFTGEEARIRVDAAHGEDWQVTYSSPTFALKAGEEYTLSFSARSDGARSLNTWLQMDRDPWTSWISFPEVTLTDQWQQFSLGGLSGGDDDAALLIFGLGRQTGSVWIRDVKITRDGPAVWRRDFEHGIVLVNATGQTQTVDLGAEYTKIDGSQDRSVNDGSRVTAVTLAAYDGIVLLSE